MAGQKVDRDEGVESVGGSGKSDSRVEVWRAEH